MKNRLLFLAVLLIGTKITSSQMALEKRILEFTRIT